MLYLLPFAFAWAVLSMIGDYYGRRWVVLVTNARKSAPRTGGDYYRYPAWGRVASRIASFLVTNGLLALVLLWQRMTRGTTGVRALMALAALHNLQTMQRNDAERGCYWCLHCAMEYVERWFDLSEVMGKK